MKRTVKLIVLAAVAAGFAAPVASADVSTSPWASSDPWASRGSVQTVDPWAWRDPWASRNPMKSGPMKSARLGYDVGHVTRVRSNPWSSRDPWASRNPMKSAPWKVGPWRVAPWGSRGCSLRIGI